MQVQAIRTQSQPLRPQTQSVSFTSSGNQTTTGNSQSSVALARVGSEFAMLTIINLVFSRNVLQSFKDGALWTAGLEVVRFLIDKIFKNKD